MRGTLDDLPSPSPLVQALPGMLLDDDFVSRFVSAFDVVVAPVFAALDNLSAYLDPGTAPADFLEWLAGWFGLELDATWAIDRRRAAVRDIVELYRWRGTTRGLRAQLQLQLDVDVDIEEGGGVSWSAIPGADLPGTGSEQLVVRLRVEDPAAIDLPRVEAMVRSVTPAHVVTSVEVATFGGTWSASRASAGHDATDQAGKPPSTAVDGAAETTDGNGG